jgi:hypothetical protein
MEGHPVEGTYLDPNHDSGMTRQVTARGDGATGEYTITGRYAKDEQPDGRGEPTPGAQWTATMTTAAVVNKDTLLAVDFSPKIRADGDVHPSMGVVHNAVSGALFWSDGNRWTRVIGGTFTQYGGVR